MDYEMEFKVLATKIIVEVVTESLYEIGQERCITDDEATFISGYVEGLTDSISVIFEQGLVPGWTEEDEPFKKVVELVKQHREEFKKQAKSSFKFS